MFSFFDRFRKDQSSDWGESFKIPLWFNFQTESFNNVKIGDSLENLRVFGRPNNRLPFRDCKFEYFLLGFDVECENDKILNFCFVFNHGFEKNYAFCELTLIAPNGMQLNANRFTKLSEIERVFGVSNDKSIVEEENYCESATYQIGRLEVSFWFLENGMLEQIIVETKI